MATIKTRVDDVLYNLDGKKVEATDTKRVSVPGVAFGKTKARRFEVDVSDKGGKTLDRLIAQAEEATQKAWADVLKACGTSAEEIQEREEKSSSDTTKAPDNSDDDEGADTDTDSHEDAGGNDGATSSPTSYGTPSP